jgi:hypothetical protein
MCIIVDLPDSNGCVSAVRFRYRRARRDIPEPPSLHNPSSVIGSTTVKQDLRALILSIYLASRCPRQTHASQPGARAFFLRRSRSLG